MVGVPDGTGHHWRPLLLSPRALGLEVCFLGDSGTHMFVHASLMLPAPVPAHSTCV